MFDLLKRWNKSRKWHRRAVKLEQRRERMLSFGKFACGLIVDGKNGTFAVDPEDDFVSKRLLQTGTYSEEELDLVKRLIRKDSRVLMVGTHIGALAVPISKLCEKMIAVEANPRTYQFLCRNLLLNACGNVTSHNLAAAEESKTIKFLLSRDNSGGSKRMPKHVSESYVYDNPEIIDVRAEPLDSLVEQRAFDLVFMDIEGSEYFALKGMTGILAESRSLVVEFIPHHLKNVAGVDSDEFISLILPNFDWMYIPEDEDIVSKDKILEKTRSMFAANKSYNALVFLKSPLPAGLIDKRPAENE